MTTKAAPGGADEKFALTTSRHFPEWLARAGATLAFTTYQAGKVIFCRLAKQRAPRGLRTQFRALHGDRFQCRCSRSLWRRNVKCSASTTSFPPAPRRATRRGLCSARRLGHRRRRRPRRRDAARTAARLRQHAVLVSVAEVSDAHNFVPLWRPPFISRLAPEDRCHLNGLAMEDGAALCHAGRPVGRGATAGATAGRTPEWSSTSRATRRRAGAFDAAFAAAAWRKFVAAQFGHRRIRFRRSGRRQIRAGGVLPRLCARARVRRRCGRGVVACAREPHVSGAGAGRRAGRARRRGALRIVGHRHQDRRYGRMAAH